MNYKFISILIIFTYFTTEVVITYFGSVYKYNYLFTQELDLKSSTIVKSKKNEYKNIFLGSSSVSGDIIPLNSSVADYFSIFSNQKSYNLAVKEGSFSDAMIILNQVKKYGINRVILGVEPGFLNDNWNSIRVLANWDIVKEIFSKNVPLELQKKRMVN